MNHPYTYEVSRSLLNCDPKIGDVYISYYNGTKITIQGLVSDAIAKRLGFVPQSRNIIYWEGDDYTHLYQFPNDNKKESDYKHKTEMQAIDDVAHYIELMKVKFHAYIKVSSRFSDMFTDPANYITFLPVEVEDELALSSDLKKRLNGLEINSFHFGLINALLGIKRYPKLDTKANTIIAFFQEHYEYLKLIILMAEMDSGIQRKLIK